MIALSCLNWFIILAIMLIMYSELRTFEDFALVWSKQPIVDAELTDQACPKGYKIVEFGQYPGTVEA